MKTDTPYVNFWYLSNLEYFQYAKLEKFARKKWIIIHKIFWSQKLRYMASMTNTNFVFKQCFVEMTFSDKMLVPYC